MGFMVEQLGKKRAHPLVRGENILYTYLPQRHKEHEGFLVFLRVLRGEILENCSH